MLIAMIMMNARWIHAASVTIAIILPPIPAMTPLLVQTIIALRAPALMIR